jgi:hypothetical protein
MSVEDARARRLAENEALVREVNERVGDVAASWYDADEKVSFVCECSLEDCGERIHLTLGEYERVRSSPAWFALVPEHILPEIERPVATIGETLVVEKLGPGREVAEETAP